MLPEKLAFVDIETTGTSASYDRIIEIGILRVENGMLKKKFQTLIDPETFIPKEIQSLTGISPFDLEKAPTFRNVMDEITEMLNDCVFVAHNVRFDYGFLLKEFKRHNISFSSKHFCTVRLSRLLYPNFSHHNLDEIIKRFNFKTKNRHRAFDDAKILFDFYKKIQKDFSEEVVATAISKCIKKPSTPVNLPANTIENLPQTPGVYVFYSSTGMPLYVGKSVNLKERVMSHFASDIHSSTEMKISQQISHIETISTAGELGALLLESQLIKKLLPLYNKKSRIKQELVAIKSRIGSNGYREAFIEAVSFIDPSSFTKDCNEQFLGFFRSRKQAKSYLISIHKENTLCEKLLGLEKTKGACFGYRLSKCKGACVGEEKSDIYNLRFIASFAQSQVLPWPYTGPIRIEEKSSVGDKEYFLIDKWCYLKNIKADDYNNQNIQAIENPAFDLDVYKILKQYLKNPKNLKRIKELSGQETSLLLQSAEIPHQL